jgi:hypothetical protein
MFRTLRPIDLAALGLVTMVASTGVTAWLGLTEPPAVIAVTMGLACPAARRMIAWRRGAVPIRFGAGGASMPVILLAMLPWLLLPALRVLPWQAVASLATFKADLPALVRWGGVVLTVAGVLRPMAATLRGSSRIRSTAYVETIGLFAATGSAFVGALAAAWIMVEFNRLRVFSAEDFNTVRQPAASA